MYYLTCIRFRVFNWQENLLVFIFMGNYTFVEMAYYSHVARPHFAQGIIDWR